MPGDHANADAQVLAVVDSHTGVTGRRRHPKRYLLAFVYGYLGEHDLLRVRTDAEKYLLLACPNLVECVAYVGAQLQSR